MGLAAFNAKRAWSVDNEAITSEFLRVALPQEKLQLQQQLANSLRRANKNICGVAVVYQEKEWPQEHWYISSAEDKTSEVEQKFQKFAEVWYQDTLVLSDYLTKILHPAYQRIIGLGLPVVPFILRELQDMPTEWFWALRAITGVDPTSPKECRPSGANAEFRRPA